jgi:hypothetical protein
MRTPVSDTIPRLAVRSPPIVAVILVASSDGVSARNARQATKVHRRAARTHGSIEVVRGVCSVRRDP